MLMLGLKEIYIINNWDIYGIYRDLHLSEKKLKEKLLQG